MQEHAPAQQPSPEQIPPQTQPEQPQSQAPEQQGGRPQPQGDGQQPPVGDTQAFLEMLSKNI
jgi:hypothetical protein